MERRPFTEGKRQIQAFYSMDLPSTDAALEWANRLPTYGFVEVRELLNSDLWMAAGELWQAPLKRP